MRGWVTVTLAALFAPSVLSICSKICDGDDSNSLKNPRLAHREIAFNVNVSLYISDEDNAAYARIDNADGGNEIWIDRSYDGGASWDIGGALLGVTKVPSGQRGAQTPAFSIDGDLSAMQIGVLRACGSFAGVIDCTVWGRGTEHSSFPAEAATTALMYYYKDNGQWATTGWWNAANCLTSVVDFMKVTGDRTYVFALDKTFEKNKNQFYGNFCNDYIDDTGWWGLAWVGAYDLTLDQKFIQTAQITCDYMYTFRDNRCGGGVYWSEARSYKNAITNELFIKLAAALHNRIPGDTKYLNWAKEIYQWFENSGMINNDNLINDGLNTDGDCKNNGDVTWTYNQGVILGGLAELYKATNDVAYLDRARSIADAVVKSSYLSPNGILHEPCDNNGNDCGGDGPSFKGAFSRNLGELNDALPSKPYSDYIRKNSETIYKFKSSIDTYGLHYEGKLEFISAAATHSALDMLTAGERLNRST